MPNLIPHEDIISLPILLQLVSLQQQLALVEHDLAAFYAALDKREKDERLTDLQREVNALRKALGGEVEPEFTPFHLTAEARKRLKFAYHKAAWLCHPDNLKASQLTIGQQWFERLQEANARRDILDVERILLALQTGEAFGKRTFSLTQLTWKKNLEQQQLARLRKELDDLRSNYVSPQQLLDEDELNFYVYEQKIVLEEELEALRWQLEKEK